MRRRSGLPAGLLLLLLAAVPALALEVPFLAGRVVDEANMLPTETRQRVEAELAALEADTGAQVAVLTIPSLEDEALEDYSLRVAETWRLGRADADDGALLLIARDDRKMRLEVGYGLEPKLTDLAANRILDEVIRPRFRQGDFGGGVEAGVAAVAAVVREGEEALPAPQPARSGSGGDLPERLLGIAVFLTVVGLFSVIAVATSGCQGWFLYVFLLPFWVAFPSALLHPMAGPVLGGCWLLGYPLLRLLFGRFGRPGWLDSSSAGWSLGGGGGSSGGGFSGGGFSGGGGSFGGGGASGSW